MTYCSYCMSEIAHEDAVENDLGVFCGDACAEDFQVNNVPTNYGLPGCCQADVLFQLTKTCHIPHRGNRVEFATTVPPQKVDDKLRKAGFRAFATSARSTGRPSITYWIRGDRTLKMLPLGPTHARTKAKRS